MPSTNRKLIGPGPSVKSLIICLTMISISVSGTGCARLLAGLAGNAGFGAGAIVAAHAQAPKAKTEIKKQGGAYCSTAVRLGWPVKTEPGDPMVLSQLSRPVKSTILKTQEFTEDTCPGAGK